MKISFKDYLLNENKAYLGQRIGDILAALQELEQNSKGMGTRQVVANAERAVNQIRRILHGNWSKKEDKYLKKLQTVGVALAKAIEEKDNLLDIIPSAVSELEQLSGNLGTPLHSLGADTQDAESAPTPPEGVGPPAENNPAQKPPQNQHQQPPQQEGYLNEATIYLSDLLAKKGFKPFGKFSMKKRQFTNGTHTIDYYPDETKWVYYANGSYDSEIGYDWDRLIRTIDSVNV